MDNPQEVYKVLSKIVQDAPGASPSTLQAEVATVVAYALIGIWSSLDNISHDIEILATRLRL
jgi:hypothetical protein